MAFLLSKNPFAAQLRSHFQLTGVQKSEDAISLSHRAFHVEPGAREKALLAEDPALKRYKSHKKSLWRLKRFGDVMTIVVVAGCCYEIYVKTVMREEARGQAKAASGSA